MRRTESLPGAGQGLSRLSLLKVETIHSTVVTSKVVVYHHIHQKIASSFSIVSPSPFAFLTSYSTMLL